MMLLFFDFLVLNKLRIDDCERSLCDNSFSIVGKTESLKFGQTIQDGIGSFVVNKRQVDIGSNPNKDIIIRWTPAIELAKNLAEQIQVASSISGSHVLTFSINQENIATAKDIVNGFLNIYQEYSLSDKRASARNTIDFINGQLELAADELGGIESNLQDFKERNKVRFFN